MSKKAIIAGITAGALMVFAGTLVHALFYAPDFEVPVPDIARSAPRESIPDSDEPSRLIVPNLEIDTDVQQVGVNAKGNMGVPSNFSDVAWYKYGTVPGYKGSAVIDGHVDNGLGLAGVFKHLNRVKKGDDIYIETKGGERLHFRVTEVASYNYKSVPLETVFNRADTARLNLITCDGAWIKNEKTYDERLVVYTVLVP